MHNALDCSIGGLMRGVKADLGSGGKFPEISMGMHAHARSHLWHAWCITVCVWPWFFGIRLMVKQTALVYSQDMSPVECSCDTVCLGLAMLSWLPGCVSACERTGTGDGQMT